MRKIFFVSNIKSYPHDANLYLIKRDPVNKIYRALLDLDKNQLFNNILELIINKDTELIKAAIKLYNEL